MKNFKQFFTESIDDKFVEFMTEIENEVDKDFMEQFNYTLDELRQMMMHDVDFHDDWQEAMIEKGVKFGIPRNQFGEYIDKLESIKVQKYGRINKIPYAKDSGSLGHQIKDQIGPSGINI